MTSETDRPNPENIGADDTADDDRVEDDTVAEDEENEGLFADRGPVDGPAPLP